MTTAAATDNLVQRFAALFRGLERAHGTYQLSGAITEKGKRDGKGTTLQESVTLEHYARHLRGDYMLGVVPIMDDGTCWFAALDVDDYTGKYVPIVDRIREANLPLVPVLSKSGGVHLYLFFSEALPCADVRAKLKELAEFLGVPGCEVFPKQDVLASKQEIGNWLNLGYYKGLLGAQHAERLMVDPRTQEKVASLEKFLDVAERMRVTPAQFEALTVEAQKRRRAPISDGPPCLQKLAESHVAEGGRNEAMTHWGVYLRKRGAARPGYDEKTLLEDMRAANRRHFDPPLDDGEVVQCARSAWKPALQYMCAHQPMAALCNHALCLRRKYGVGDPSVADSERPDFGGLIRYEVQRPEGGSAQEEPWYDMTINGVMVRFTNAQLYEVSQFRKRVADVLSFFPPAMKAADWTKFLNSQFQGQQLAVVPFEAGPKGQIVGHVRDFVRDYSNRDEWTALIGGGAYIDRKAMVGYFRWQDLLAYLNRKNVRGLREAEVFGILQSYMEGRSGDRTIDGKHVRYWAVVVKQTDVPPPEEQRSEY